MIVPPETEQLARLVAARSGKTLEDVLKQGVEMAAHVAGIPLHGSPPASRSVNIAGARAIARRVAERPLRDTRKPHAILDEAWGRSDGRR